MAKQLPNSPRKFRSLADLPPEEGLEESPLVEIPGMKEVKRSALGGMRDAGVPEVAVDVADVLIPEAPDGVMGSGKKAMRAVGKAKKALSKADDVAAAQYAKNQHGHEEVKKMLGLSSDAPDLSKAAAKVDAPRTINYGNLDKDPAKRIPRGEVHEGKFRPVESEALSQDRMESLERLKKRNPDRYQTVIKKWKEKGILPPQEGE